MGGYSVFAGTIADMTWSEVETAAASNTPILVPVAVIEQHSRHLPLATDTYGAYLLCLFVQKHETIAEGVDIAGLVPVPDTPREFQQAETSGGWRELSPDGHIGDPAKASPENGELCGLEAADMAAALRDFLAARP